MGRSWMKPAPAAKTKSDKEAKREKARAQRRRMHARNLISQWQKNEMRAKVHSDPIEFETDRQKLVDHAKAVKYFRREKKLLKELLAYYGFSSSMLSERQKEKLEDSKWDTPKHLFRVASDISARHYQSTKGLDSKDIHVPAISCVKHDGKGLEKGIHHIANSLIEERDIISKLGHRLMWDDRNSDPFLSWTPSMLFVLVLGTARKARGERSIHITSVDTEQAQQAKIVKSEYKVERNADQSIALRLDNGTVTRAGSTKFYSAERLLRVTNARCWNNWKPGQVSKLTNDWYTGEWLSHGIVLSDKNSYRANLLDILDDELYDYHEQLVTAENEDMKSLYHRCVRARSLAFSVHNEATLLTIEELQKASRHAARFVVSGNDKEKQEELDSLVPPLHIFLSILGLKKRVRKDHLFMQWIRDHYTPSDITACDYSKTTKIANNLPEVMETLHLARDACIALLAPEIPAIHVWLADPDFDFDGQWLHQFPKEVKIKASRAGKPKLGEVPNFDKDGMALEVVVGREGWVVRREWKDEGEVEDEEEQGDGEEAQSQEDRSMDLEAMVSVEDEGEEAAAEKEGVDEEMVVDAPDEARARVTDEDEDEGEGGNEIPDVQMSGGDVRALGSSISEGDVTASDDDGGAKQKQPESEMAREEDMALV
ncbi:hypothetical protein M409DRAFT_20251 [Zasmidium cellare ATCC 36951]|uniref:Uncharacterized protein n=1 Tax=Zasmidium cellare ATCC 36951 TaxID=1080233 RepID=A0A6A6CUI0_ZASCE|nr:uncharacterized protein M409DRAFT_20251 [Zasmidium cellare ATCC 36951]KAF2169838.1 hypothetical protein M409DRAFT_20251 [Zasmidium cellare ATCC 36951]